MDQKNIHVSEKKRIIRREQRLLNGSISHDRLEKAGRKIFEKLTMLPLFLDAKTVFCYVSAYAEIDTLGILQTILDSGKECSVPKCFDHGMMEARIIHDLSELHKGKFGLMEPPDDSAVQECPDLCIMPCVACTPDGIRLGQGGGYYDRYLSSHRTMHTMILAGSWQIRRTLPYAENDMRAGLILTDKDDEQEVFGV